MWIIQKDLAVLKRTLISLILNNTTGFTESSILLMQYYQMIDLLEYGHSFLREGEGQLTILLALSEFRSCTVAI